MYMSIHDADLFLITKSSACNSTQSVIHGDLTIIFLKILTICLSITNSINSDSFIVLGTLLVRKCSIRHECQCGLI